jgi:hypothetical protein
MGLRQEGEKMGDQPAHKDFMRTKNDSRTSEPGFEKTPLCSNSELINVLPSENSTANHTENNKEFADPSSDIRSVVIKDGIVLLNMVYGKALRANRLGCAIWFSLKEGKSTYDLIHFISAQCSMSEEEAERAINTFISALTREAFVILDRRE